MVVSGSDVKQRSDTIVRIIELATKLQECSNFFGKHRV
jgi:hypothetical protein